MAASSSSLSCMQIVAVAALALLLQSANAEKTINVVYTVDENFVVGMAASLSSLLQTSTSGVDVPAYHIFIVDGGMKPQSLRALQSDFSINAGPADELTILSGVQSPGPAFRGSRTPNIRLSLHEILPSHLKRVVYLDCDTIIKRHLVHMPEIPSIFPIAACRDLQLPFGPPHLGFAETESPYFNSGVLVFDLVAWRTGNFNQNLREALDNPLNKYPDQDALNMVFRDTWFDLGSSWNDITGSAPAWMIESAPAFIQTLLRDKDVGVIHYIGPVRPSFDLVAKFGGRGAKPWSFIASHMHPYAEDFFEALDRTSYEGWRPSVAQLASLTQADDIEAMLSWISEHGILTITNSELASRALEFDPEQLFAPLPGMEPMNIVFACDQNFVMGLAVSISSALQHSTRPVRMFVLDGGITDHQSIKRTFSAASKFNDDELVFVDASFSGGLKWRNSTATYLRLLLPEILPQAIEKVLYLDVDVLIRHDLADLYDQPLEHPVSAVVDVAAPFGFGHLKRLGRSPSSLYFNAGVFLANLTIWRQENATSELIDLVDRSGSLLLFKDQDALNLLFEGRFTALPVLWNVFAFSAPDAYLRSWTGFQHLPLATNLLQHARVVHFLGPASIDPAVAISFEGKHGKPWSFLSLHPLRSLWFEQLDTTAFKGWRPISAGVASKAVDYIADFTSICARLLDMNATRFWLDFASITKNDAK